MSQLPSDFFSWKSFQSLTQTAAIAWGLTLIVDVVFVMRIENKFDQLMYIWIIGFIICLILAIIRLYFKEQKEKGDKIFVIFNAALIFLYASGFNGVTKELGSWNELSKTLDTKESSVITPGNEEALPVSLASWIPNIFAEQTSFWPDVKVIAENNDLKSENRILSEKIEEMKSMHYPDYKNLINDLNSQIEILQTTNRVLTSENQELNNQLTQAGERIKELDARLARLSERISQNNSLQETWRNKLSEHDPSTKIRDTVIRIFGKENYNDFFETPISLD